jgi:hypothetical protein
VTRIPVDSADARELREIEAEADALDRRHDELCRAGLLGEDRGTGLPIPCPRCRPHLFAGPCPTCAQRRATCSERRRRTGRRCCDECTHSPVPELSQLLNQVVDRRTTAREVSERGC